MQFWGAIGAGFSHAPSTTWYKKSDKVTWKHGEILDTTFWFDNAIKDGIKGKCRRKVAWLLEGHSIIPEAVNFVKNNVELVSSSYEFLLTHNKEISELAPNFHFMFPHGFWLEKAQLYHKTKLISMISSNKNWTEGHRKRLEWVERLRNHVTLYGQGFNPFERHEDALCDYCFTIVIENKEENWYITEKLLSALAAGCVVAYSGSDEVGKFFNTGSILKLDENFDINCFTESFYWDRIEAVKDNIERVKKFNLIENIVLERFFQ